MPYTSEPIGNPKPDGSRLGQAMHVNPLFVLEFLLFDAGAIGWAAWEYWRIRPSKTRRDDVPPSSKASPEDPGHPEG